MSDSQSIAAPYQGSVPKGVLLGLLLHLLQFLLVPGIGLLLGVFYPDKNLLPQPISFRLTPGALRSLCIWGRRPGSPFAGANEKQVKVF